MSQLAATSAQLVDSKKELPVFQQHLATTIRSYPGSTRKLSKSSRLVCSESEVFCVRFDADDSLIAAGCSDGSVKIFNTANKKLEQSLSTFTGINGTPTTALRWRPAIHSNVKQILVTANADGSIIHWHAPSGKQLHHSIELNNSVLCIDFNRDGSLYATAGKDFKVRVYDDDTKSESICLGAAEWNSPGHSNRVFSVKFVPSDPNLLISGGWDSNVQVWDLRQSKSIRTIFGPSLSGDSLDISDGVILTGSYRNDNQLQLWDFATKKLIKNIPLSDNPDTVSLAYLYAAQFSKTDKNIIATGSSGVNQFTVFDSKNSLEEPILACSVDNIKEGVYSIDFANRSNLVAYAGGEGVINILDLS